MHRGEMRTFRFEDFLRRERGEEEEQEGEGNEGWRMERSSSFSPLLSKRRRLLF